MTDSIPNGQAIKSEIPDMPLPFQETIKSKSDRLDHIRREKLHSDCQFQVGERIFDAHKLILAVTSPVFEAMFYGSLAESTKEPILIVEMQPETFEHLLDYIYTERFNFESVADTIDLMLAAKRYIIIPLQEQCSNYLQNNIDDSNVLEIHEFAVLFDDNSLQTKCLQKLNGSDTKQSPDMVEDAFVAVLRISEDSYSLQKHEYFIRHNTTDVLCVCDYSKVSIDTLVTVLNQDYLNIYSELQLFNAIEKFAESRETNSEKASENDEIYKTELKLQEAVRSIRFLTMSPEEFVSGPSASKLLLPHESLAILSRLVSSNLTKLPYPEGFSQSVESRRDGYYRLLAIATNTISYGYGKWLKNSYWPQKAKRTLLESPSDRPIITIIDILSTQTSDYAHQSDEGITDDKKELLRVEFNK